MHYHRAGRQVSDFDDFMQLLRQWSTYNSNVDFRISSLFSYEGAPTRDGWLFKSWCEENQFKDDNSDRQIATICQASSVQFAVSQIATIDHVTHVQSPTRRLSDKYFKLIEEVPPLNLRIYQVLEPLPIAYFISKWRSVGSSDDAFRVMVATEPFEPHKYVVLERQANSQPLAPGHDGRTAASTDVSFMPVAPADYSYDRVVLPVDAPCEGVVVFNDSYYPGWSASIDGQPAPVLCANGRFKAVTVGKGQHTVIFSFYPQLLSLGALLGAASILALLIAGFVIARAARGPQPCQKENRAQELP